MATAAEVASSEDECAATEPGEQPQQQPEEEAGTQDDNNSRRPYYYWHGDAERRRQISGEVKAPLPTPQRLDAHDARASAPPAPLALRPENQDEPRATGAEEGAPLGPAEPINPMVLCRQQDPHNTALVRATSTALVCSREHLVTSDGGLTWNPLPKTTTTLAMPVLKLTSQQLFTTGKYTSPPREWPEVFGTSKILKAFVKRLKGKALRLIGPPHPLELQRLKALECDFTHLEPLSNALAVRRLLGWDVVGGFILYELAQGKFRNDKVEKPEYHGEPHWWNVTPKGAWVDLTPRNHHRDLVLVESSTTKVPPPTEEEVAALAAPARTADVLTIDVSCEGTHLRGLVLARKQLDGGDRDKPAPFLSVCVDAAKAPFEAASGTPLDRHAISRVLLEGRAPRAPVMTAARELLPRSGLCVSFEMIEKGTAQHLLLKRMRTSLPELREVHTLFMSHRPERADRSPPFGAPELLTLRQTAEELGMIAVRTLHLNGNGLGPEGTHALCKLLTTSHLPYLDKLVLSHNGLGDESLPRLIEALAGRSNPLSFLDLSANGLTDAGLDVLMHAIEGRTLQVNKLLDVTDNPATTVFKREDLEKLWTEATEEWREIYERRKNRVASYECNKPREKKKK